MTKLLFVPQAGGRAFQPDQIAATSVDANVAAGPLATLIAAKFSEMETARNELFALAATAERERYYAGVPGRQDGEITTRANRIAQLEGELKYLQTALSQLNGSPRRPILPGIPRTERTRVTTAQVNAGFTLVAGVPGFALRMRDCTVIAIGGAAGAVTTVDVLGTSSGSRKLVAFGQAALTQSTPLYPGIAGATVLADGASFTANDAGTAITIGKTGSNVTVATAFDVLLDYVVD